MFTLSGAQNIMFSMCGVPFVKRTSVGTLGNTY